MIAKGIVAGVDNCGGTHDPAQTENPLEHPDGSHPQAPKAGGSLEVSDDLNPRDTMESSACLQPPAKLAQRGDDGATLRSATRPSASSLACFPGHETGFVTLMEGEPAFQFSTVYPRPASA